MKSVTREEIAQFMQDLERVAVKALELDQRAYNEGIEGNLADAESHLFAAICVLNNITQAMISIYTAHSAAKSK